MNNVSNQSLENKNPDQNTPETFGNGEFGQDHPAPVPEPEALETPTPAPTEEPEPTQSPTDAPLASFEPTPAAETGNEEGTEAHASVTATPSPKVDGEKDNGHGAGIWVIAALVIVVAAAVVLILRRIMAKEPETPVAPGRNGRNISTKIPNRVYPEAPKTEVAEDGEEPVRYSVGYAQTVGSRGNQEDAYCISDWKNTEVVAARGILAVVADGIGGMNNGHIASGTVVRDMSAQFDRQTADQPISNRLLDLAAHAHQEVRHVVDQIGQCGTTLVSVLIQDGRMVMLSIGDSRVALYRSGILLQLNREHVFGNEMDENSALHAAVRDAGSKRKAITSYVGKENLRLIDRTVNPLQLVPGDRVLLMSDGVFGTLSDDEIIAFMKLNPDQAAQAIVRAVEEKKQPHQDNATIVIVGMN